MPMNVAVTTSPWRDRRFQIFAAGNAINNVGEAIYAVALPLLAYELTGSLVVMSLLAAIFPAMLLLAPLRGLVVDRWGPRVFVVPGLLLQLVAAIALNLLAFADNSPIWPLFVFGALIEIGGSAYRTGWMTGVATMFPDNPTRARGSLGTVYVVTTVTEPALIAVLLPRLGYEGMLWMNVATFAAPIVVWLVGVHPPRTQRPTAAARPVRDLVSSWQALRSERRIVNATVVGIPMLLVSTTGTLTLAIFQLRDVWQVRPDAVGMILVAVRLGALLGTVAVSERRSFNLRQIVTVSTIGMVICLFAMVPITLSVFVAALVLFYIFQAAQSVTFDMMIFRFLPVDVLGRVGGILDVIHGIPALAGPLLIPALVGVTSVPVTFALLGLIGVSGVGLLVRSWNTWQPAHAQAQS